MDPYPDTRSGDLAMSSSTQAPDTCDLTLTIRQDRYLV